MATDVIYFDFPPMGGNIYRSRAAINQSLTEGTGELEED